jgi:uncharacterized protein YecT (DUF1311 family)
MFLAKGIRADNLQDDQDAIEKQHADCLNDLIKAGTAGGCLVDLAAAYEKELNHVYQKDLSDLDAKTAAKTRDAQMQWQAFRQSDDAAIDLYEGHDPDPKIRAIAQLATIELVRERIGHLMFFNGIGWG